MTGPELRAIREALDMSPREFAAELGYQGSEKNNATRIEKYERGVELIPLYMARLAWSVHQHFLEFDALPDWPQWPAYADGVPTKHKRRPANPFERQEQDANLYGIGVVETLPDGTARHVPLSKIRKE